MIWFRCCILTDLDDEDNHKADVEDNEDCPEEPVRVEDADNLQDESHTDSQEDLVSGVGDVTVTELINLENRLETQPGTERAKTHLEENQDGDAIHKGRVKLEVLCGGADVITATEDSCSDE